MIKHEVSWQKSIFARLVFLFLIIIVPIYSIGFNIYNWGIGTVRNEISNSMEMQGAYYLNNLETEIQRIQTLQFDCLNDENLNMLAGASQIMSNYERDQAILRVQQRMTAIKNSSRYIMETSTHIIPLRKTVSTTDVRDIDNEEYEMMKAYTKNSSGAIYYWKGRLLVNTAAAYFNNSNTGLQRYFIKTELSDKELGKVLESLDTNDESGSFIFGQDNKYINIGNSNPETVLNIMKYIQNNNIFSQRNALSIEFNKKKYFTIFAKSDYLNLMLVRYIPENVVFKKVNLYRVWFWVFSIVTLCIIILFSFFTNKFIHKPLSRLVKAFGKIEKGELDVDIRHKNDDEFKYIYERFNTMVCKLNELIDQVYKQRILVQKAELKQLQSQINPHFLYNSFFILSRRVKYGDTENAVLFCNQLGNYFQFITRSAADEVPLCKEVEHAGIYADIQAARFMNRITVEFQPLPGEYDNIFVPRLILQPLIENAFEHGLEQKEEAGRLIVRFVKISSFLHIIVEDNGERMTDCELENISRSLIETQNDIETTAIINIHKRIRLMFGEHSGVDVSRSELGGLKITISIELGGL